MKKLGMEKMEDLKGGIDWMPALCAANWLIAMYPGSSNNQFEAALTFFTSYCIE